MREKCSNLRFGRSTWDTIGVEEFHALARSHAPSTLGVGFAGSVVARFLRWRWCGFAEPNFAELRRKPTLAFANIASVFP